MWPSATASRSRKCASPWQSLIATALGPARTASLPGPCRDPTHCASLRGSKLSWREGGSGRIVGLTRDALFVNELSKLVYCGIEVIEHPTHFARQLFWSSSAVAQAAPQVRLDVSQQVQQFTHVVAVGRRRRCQRVKGLHMGISMRHEDWRLCASAHKPARAVSHRFRRSGWVEPKGAWIASG